MWSCRLCFELDDGFCGIVGRDGVDLFGYRDPFGYRTLLFPLPLPVPVILRFHTPHLMLDALFEARISTFIAFDYHPPDENSGGP